MLNDLKAELEKIGSHGRLRELHRAEKKVPGIIETRGRTLVDFCSTDFLGAGRHRRVFRSAQEDLEQRGIFTGSPRLLAGTADVHLALERRLAQYFGAESALLFSSRNQLVWSLVTSLVGESDFVLTSESSISPVADAAFLVNCAVGYFDSISLQGLESELEKHKGSRRTLIFVESVVPLLGERSRMAELREVASKYNAILISDDSFFAGLFGARGVDDTRQDSVLIQVGGIGHGGTVGLLPTDIRYVDLSVSLGGFGAALVGPVVLRDYLLNSSKSFSLESSLPSSIVAASDAAIDIVELSAGSRQRLAALARRLRRGLVGLGYKQDPHSDVPIIAISVASYQVAREFCDGLFAKGFLVEALPRKSLLNESGIVRVVLNSFHVDRQVDDLIRAFAEVAIFNSVPRGT